MSTINTLYMHDVCFTASVTIMYQFKSNEKGEVYVLWDALLLSCFTFKEPFLKRINSIIINDWIPIFQRSSIYIKKLLPDLMCTKVTTKENKSFNIHNFVKNLKKSICKTTLSENHISGKAYVIYTFTFVGYPCFSIRLSANKK